MLDKRLKLCYSGKVKFPIGGLTVFDVRQIIEGEAIPVESEITITVPVVFGLKEAVVLKYTGELSKTNEGFLFEGEAEAVLSAHCNRCLKTCHTPVTFVFFEDFVEKGSKVLDGWELEYTNHIIDIKPALERNLFNNIPMKFVCADSCGGICPRCGMDQNLSICSCDNEPDGEFADLLSKFK